MMQGAQPWCSVTTWGGGKEWEVEGNLKRDEIDVYPGPVHVNIWQKPTWYCRPIILHLKINKLKKMTNQPSRRVLDGFKRYFLIIVLMIVFNFCRLKMQILRV